MYRLYYTKSGAAWSSKQLIWQSDMAIDPDKYGLYDLKCSVELNKAGELKFVMTKACSSYDLFAKERSVLTLLMDDSTTIFRGVVKLIETDLFFQRTITANSDLIYLSDSVFRPHGEDIEETPKNRFKRIINNHNVQMQGDPEKQIKAGSFTFEDGANDKEKYMKNGGYKDTMSQLQNDFKDFYGFYNIRYNADYSKKWLDFTETTGKSTSQDIKFAVNIEDYQFKDTVDDLFTILIPFGGDNLTLTNQNAHRTVNIRKPDQSKEKITVYVVGKYIKIVPGIKKYGYIYLAESFTVDSNNIGSSGSDGRVGGNSSGDGSGSRSGYTYTVVVPEGNPAAEGLYYYSNGSYVRATETTPYYNRTYYKRSESRTTYYKVSPESGANPKANGWLEYSNGSFVKTSDTSVVSGKTYYSTTRPGSGSGGGDDSGGGGGDGTQYGYRAVSNVGPNTNPAANGWYEKRAFTIDSYILTTDTTPVPNKTYYIRYTRTAQSNTSTSYESNGSDGDNENESTEPEYEFTPVVNVASSDNPAESGWYEKQAFTEDTYVLTADTSPIPNKTYYILAE